MGLGCWPAPFTMGNESTPVGCIVPSGDCVRDPEAEDGVTGPDMFGKEKTGAGGICTRRSGDFWLNGGCEAPSAVFDIPGQGGGGGFIVVLKATTGTSVMATSVDAMSTEGVEDEILGLRPLESVGDSR